MGRPRKTKSGVRIDPKTGKADSGRPTKMTKLVVKKLEESFSYDCTDTEACIYAGISRQTLWNYQKENPEFVDKKEMLKKKPLLKARKTIVDNLDDVKNAQWYAERKAKDEFSIRTEHTGKDGDAEQHVVSVDDISGIIKSLPKNEQANYYAFLADIRDRLGKGAGSNTGKRTKQNVHKKTN